VTPSALTATRRDLIVSLAARFNLPAIYSFGFYAESGGLISYGINQLEQARRPRPMLTRFCGAQIRAICPFNSRSNTKLVINLKTAAASASPCLTRSSCWPTK